MTGLRTPVLRAGRWPACAAGAVLLASAAAVAAEAGPWLEYHNERYGFSLRVPARYFVEGISRNPEAGNVWISRNRQARLIAVAGPNETGGSLDSYRSFVMAKSYAGARFDYMPVHDDWFVLSGVKGNQVFYERVTFVCDGRYIYGWQMFYPVGQKRVYDRVVEEVHRNYRVGSGEGGSCD
ncbi:MAG: hypothetical protein KJZ80_11075 [Hyphomicrobiaceae bacterium]|nr:hypothetical protein [Hyphomicrobiaceae bacterium]